VHGTWEPVPAARWEDAFLVGSGRHGDMVFGDPDDDRTMITHNELVRPNGGEHARPPRLAGQLPALQGRLPAGETAAAESFTDGRGLQWVQPFHPAFQVRLRRTPGERRDCRRSVDFTTGEIEAVCGARRSRVFVSRADDVVVQYVTAPGLTADISLDPRLPGTPPELQVESGTAPTADGRRGAENDSAHGHLHHALAAARLGDAARASAALRSVLDQDFFHASLMSSHYPHRDVCNADAAHALPAVVIESLVQSTPDRLVLLPAPVCPTGRITEVRTRFGAEVDLSWSPEGMTVRLAPARDAHIDLRTSTGSRPLDLRAGEDRVLTLGPR